MTNDRNLAGPIDQPPDLAFCLVPAYMAAAKSIRGDDLRLAVVSGGWSGPAAELIPLQDTADVARVSIGVASDRDLPPQALRIAIAIGIDVDAGGCFTLDMKALERHLRPLGIGGRQIGKSLDAMNGREHIRQLADGQFQIQTNGRNFKPVTELEQRAMLAHVSERLRELSGATGLDDDGEMISVDDEVSELMANGYLSFENGDLVISTPGRGRRILSIDQVLTPAAVPMLTEKSEPLGLRLRASAP